MTISVLDDRTALIVIDLQKGILAAAGDAAAAVVAQAARLAAAFRAAGLPVVLVNVAGGAAGRTESAVRLPPMEDWTALAPELNAQKGDHLVTKYTWGAFTNTRLHDGLQSDGVTQVVIVGVATSIGVESTARFASELGYNVVVVRDAVADLRPEPHENSLANIFPRLGEVGDVAEVLALLAARA